MKQIFESIWNAPADQIESAMRGPAVAGLITVVVMLVIIFIMYRRFMRRYKEEEQKFDRDFNSFNPFYSSKK